MKARVLIVEDNPITSQDLKEILTQSDMEVTGVARSTSEALSIFQANPPDVALVDIKLQGDSDGIEFVHLVHEEHQVPVVYLTANSDRETVERAFGTNPASFLTKPFDDQDVILAIELAFKTHFSRAVSFRTQRDALPFVFLKSGNRFEKVELSTILYVEADGSYCKVVAGDKMYTLTGNLTHFSDKIDNVVFLRVHRSYIVNIENVTGVDSNYVFVGDKPIPVGRSYKPDVGKLLKRFS
ncbi:MAG: response regulator [Cyclobacteriaceae bacterium]|nr:response regulator [Cyclobacteriaceae bacterium HetDA_MAG_MS6]